MRNLPSLQYLREQALATFTRFSVTVTYGLINAFLAILVNHQVLTGHRSILLWKALGVGIPIALGLRLLGESQSKLKISPFKLELSSILGIVAVFFAFRNRHDGWSWFQYIQLHFAVFLFVIFARFLTSRDQQLFWNFNKALFIRLFTTIVFSNILYLGIFAILWTIEHLLGIKINHRLYLDFWYVSQFGFAIWFFLAGVPDDPQVVSDHYPKVLKILTQYLLIPLVTIYFLILYIYMAKIIVIWQLPKGNVATLVCAASFFGILALLLVYPIQEQTQNLWMKGYTKVFYYALFPLVVLMAFGLKHRISQYGVTEERYLLTIYALWLMAIALYFSLAKTKDIKLIPITLSVLTFTTAFGPVSAGSFAFRSQNKQLLSIFLRTGILSDPSGQIKKPTKQVSFQDSKNLTSVLDYLINRHGIESIKHWLTQEILKGIDDKKVFSDSPWVELRAYDVTPKIMAGLGLRYVGAWENVEKDRFEYRLDYRSENNRALQVTGYDYLVEELSSWNQKKQYESVGLTIEFDKLNKSLLTIKDLEGKKVLMQIALLDFAKQLRSKYQDSQAPKVKTTDLEWVIEGGSIKVKIVFRSLRGSLKPGTEKVDDFQAKMLIKRLK